MINHIPFKHTPLRDWLLLQCLKHVPGANAKYLSTLDEWGMRCYLEDNTPCDDITREEEERACGL